MVRFELLVSWIFVVLCHAVCSVILFKKVMDETMTMMSKSGLRSEVF